MSNIKKGKFIVFEGIDGSGKGTQIDLLVKEIKRQGGSVVQTAEPTNTNELYLFPRTESTAENAGD